MLAAIAGADPLDPTASQCSVPDYLAMMTRGFSGLRLGMGISWAYLVLGELTGVPDGLGAVIMGSRNHGGL